MIDWRWRDRAGQVWYLNREGTFVVLNSTIHERPDRGIVVHRVLYSKNLRFNTIVEHDGQGARDGRPGNEKPWSMDDDIRFCRIVP